MIKFFTFVLFFLISISVNAYSLNIPVVNEGKIISFNNFATNMHNLLVKNNIGMSKTEWLSELIFNKKNSFERKIFVIKNKNIIKSLNIKEEKNYSINDIYIPLLNKLNLFLSLNSIKIYNRTKDQNEFIELYYNFLLVLKLNSLFSFICPNLIKNDLIFSHYDCIKYKLDLKDFDYHVEEKSINEILSKIGNFYMFPIDKDKWINLDSSFTLENFNEGIEILNDIAKSFFLKDDKKLIKFNSDLNKYYLSFLKKDEKIKLFFDNVYNKFSLIYINFILYFISFLFIFSFYLLKNNIYYTFSRYFFIASLFLNFLILFLRILISFRAPVSNLFESILFVNFVISFLLFFLINKQNNNLMMIFVLFFITLLQYIIYKYDINDGNIRVLIPVLNTNFWLTFHVSVITIGYAFSIFFSILGHVLIFFLTKYDIDSKFVIKFFNFSLFFCLLALFFMTIGTFLGGIWADQSWGRFWGWDPKENGALFVIIWLIFILHIRFTNFFSLLFFSIFSILTNIFISLSWFGVNLLNAGLHSYGFIENVGNNLLIFFLLEFFFILFFLFLIIKKRNLNKF